MRTIAIERFISKPLKNFLFIIIGNGIRWILSFFVTVYLARVLGASGFGKLSLAFSIFAYGVLLSDLGLTIYGTREVARNKEGVDEITSKIVSLRLLLSVFAFFLLLLFALFVPLENVTRVLLLLYSFSLFFYAFYLDWFYRGRERMSNIAVASIITQAVYVGLVFIIVKGADSIMKIPLLWFIAIGSGTAFILILFFINKHRLKFHIDFSLLKLSIPVGIAVIMNQVYFHFDLITIGLIKGALDVGLYNAAFKIITFLLFIDTAFAWVYLPMVSRFFLDSKEKLKTLVFTSMKFISLIVIPLAFGGTLLGERIMLFIYGAKYIGAIAPFRILVWAIPLTSIQTVFAFGLLGCNREKKYSYGMVIGTLLNIVFNLILIPHFGINGAATATLISEVVMFVAMFLWFKEIFFIPFYRYLLKPLLATVIMVVVMLLLWKVHTFYIIVIAVFVYSLAIWSLRGITGEDIKLLRGGYGAIHRNN